MRLPESLSPPHIPGPTFLRLAIFIPRAQGEYGRTNLLITAVDDGGVAHGGLDTSHVRMLSLDVLPLPRILSITPALGARHGHQLLTIRGDFLGQLQHGDGDTDESESENAGVSGGEACSSSSAESMYVEDGDTSQQQVDNAITVLVGGRECRNVTLVSANELMCLTPPLPTGADPEVAIEVHVEERTHNSASGQTMVCVVVRCLFIRAHTKNTISLRNAWIRLHELQAAHVCW
jgi:hypothetical protein